MQSFDVPWKRSGWGLSMCWFALAFALYTWQASSFGYWLDSGEFVAVAADIGISHPPGHPLWTLWSQLVCVLPFGSMAFRCSVFSALCMALAVRSLFLAVRHTLWSACLMQLPQRARTQQPWIDAGASIAALSFMTAPAVFMQALRPEVYALHAMLALWLLERVACMNLHRNLRRSLRQPAISMHGRQQPTQSNEHDPIAPQGSGRVLGAFPQALPQTQSEPPNLGRLGVRAADGPILREPLPFPLAKGLGGALLPFGLGLGNHHFLMLLLAPVLVMPVLRPIFHGLLGLRRRVSLRAHGVFLLASASVALCGLAVYALLPLRTLAGAKHALGHPSNWSNFLWVVSAKTFQRNTGGHVPGDFGDRCMEVCMVLIDALGWMACGTALLGIYLAIRKRSGGMWLYVVVAHALARAYLGFVHGNLDAAGYLVPAVAGLCAFAGMAVGMLGLHALHAIDQWKHSRNDDAPPIGHVPRAESANPLASHVSASRDTASSISASREPAWGQGIAIGVAITFLGISLGLHADPSAWDAFRTFDATDAWGDHAYRNLPIGSVVALHQPFSVFAWWSIEAEEHLRPDVHMLPTPLLHYPQAAVEWNKALLRGSPRLRSHGQASADPPIGVGAEILGPHGSAREVDEQPLTRDANLRQDASPTSVAWLQQIPDHGLDPRSMPVHLPGRPTLLEIDPRVPLNAWSAWSIEGIWARSDAWPPDERATDPGHLRSPHDKNPIRRHGRSLRAGIDREAALPRSTIPTSAPLTTLWFDGGTATGIVSRLRLLEKAMLSTHASDPSKDAAPRRPRADKESIEQLVWLRAMHAFSAAHQGDVPQALALTKDALRLAPEDEALLAFHEALRATQTEQALQTEQGNAARRVDIRPFLPRH